MCNNVIFLSNPVKRVQLLIHLTLWTFSVDSYRNEGLQPFPKPLGKLKLYR